MTKQLENTLDLPDSDIPTNEEVLAALDQAKYLEKQFEKIDGFELHDHEMDEVANQADEAFEDLLKLSMNVEVRHAGEIAAVASQMLKIKLDSKNNKVDKKLKLLRLQIDKMRIDRMMKSEEGNTIDGSATPLDRNEILKQLHQMDKEDK